MKKSSELLGLPVVSITDGAEIGRVKEIILNPVKAEIMGLVVQDDCWWREARVVSFALIYGLGEYAATIENTSALAPLSSMPDYESLLQKKVHAKGSQLITRSGRLIGTVTEYYVDTKTGKLEGYELQPSPEISTSSKILRLPSSCVLTLGKNIVVVSEDVEDYLTETDTEFAPSPVSSMQNGPVAVMSHAPSAQTPSVSHALRDEIVSPALTDELSGAQPEEELFESISFPEDESPAQNDEASAAIEMPEPAAPAPVELKVEEPVVEAAKPLPAAVHQPTAAEEPAKKAQDLSKIFEERQKKFLLGKKTSRSIETADGTVIVNEGEMITEDVIAKAKTHGKFMELSISVKME